LIDFRPGIQKAVSFLKKGSGIKPVQVVTVSVIILFLLFNTFKCTFFNLFITDSKDILPHSIKFHIFFNILTLTSFFYLLLLKRKWVIWFVAFYAGQLFFLSVNLTYYFYFQGYLHPNQYFELWGETLELAKHTAVPFDPKLLTMFIDLPFFVAIIFLYKHISRNRKTAFSRYSLYITGFMFCIVVGMWNPVKNGNPLDIMDDRYISEFQAVKKFGLLPVDLIGLLKYNENKKLVDQLQSCNRKISSPGDSVVPKPNICIIQIESFDAFVLFKTIKGKPVAPNLYAMSRKYVYYPYTLSYHKAGSTSDCEFSCINSVEALDRFPSIKIRNYNFPNSLPKQFAKNKYSIAIFHGNRGEYFNRRIAFKKMGFPVFYDMMDMNLKEVCWGAPDGDVFNYVEGKIATVTEPFFFYTITMSSHEPFTFTKTYHNAPVCFQKIKDERVRNYLICINYVDKVVTKFISDVRKLYPNTYFVIFGDHTPPGVRGKSYHEASMKENDIFFEFVPMIIITPDSMQHLEKEIVASFLDVAPTVLNASHCPYSIKSYGIDLLSSENHGAKLPFRGIDFDRKELYKQIDAVRKTYK
jgi:lipoteichoic acid synthase